MADITKAQKLLNFKPSINLQDGLNELAGWAETHGWGAKDLFEKALKESGRSISQPRETQACAFLIAEIEDSSHFNTIRFKSH